MRARQAEWLAEREAEEKQSWQGKPKPAPVKKLAPQLGVWRIALGVFLGNLLFSAFAGILYGFSRL